MLLLQQLDPMVLFPVEIGVKIVRCLATPKYLTLLASLAKYSWGWYEAFVRVVRPLVLQEKIIYPPLRGAHDVGRRFVSLKPEKKPLDKQGIAILGQILEYDKTMNRYEVHWDEEASYKLTYDAQTKTEMIDIENPTVLPIVTVRPGPRGLAHNRADQVRADRSKDASEFASEFKKGRLYFVSDVTWQEMWIRSNHPADIGNDKIGCAYDRKYPNRGELIVA